MHDQTFDAFDSDAFNMNMLELGALAASLAPRIEAHAANNENQAEAKQILEDRITAREAIREVIADARKLDLLATRASLVGSLGRATGLADLLLEKYADLFTGAGKQILPRLRKLDPKKTDRAYRALWTIVNIERETMAQAIERMRRVDEILSFDADLEDEEDAE